MCKVHIEYFNKYKYSIVYKYFTKITGCIWPDQPFKWLYISNFYYSHPYLFLTFPPAWQGKYNYSVDTTHDSFLVALMYVRKINGKAPQSSINNI